jgi:hypothetical protein
VSPIPLGLRPRSRFEILEDPSTEAPVSARSPNNTEPTGPHLALERRLRQAEDLPKFVQAKNRFGSMTRIAGTVETAGLVVLAICGLLLLVCRWRCPTIGFNSLTSANTPEENANCVFFGAQLLESRLKRLGRQ